MANFLGKKISLISKAGIRYEGILYTIDQTAFTVALSKVKSFGTEDRTTDRFIAARDEVYEYIIFRGSDISDLHVCENSLYTDDSAIVKIMSPNITNPSSPPIAQTQLHGVNADVSTSETKSHGQSEPLSQTEANAPISISKRFMNFSKVNSSNTRGDDHQRDYNQTESHQRSTKRDKYDSEDLEEIAAQGYRQFQNRDQAAKTDFYDHFPEDNHHQQQQQQQRYNEARVRRPAQRQQQQNYRNNESRGPSYGGRGYNGGGGGGGGSNRVFRSNKELSVDVIKDDFDFESANALMAEELAHMHVHEAASKGDHVTEGHNDDDDHDDIDASGGGGEDPGETERPFYDKKKSFFDNISSEVTDRTGGGGGGPRHKNNVETFGTSEYGGRTGGRGGGYRGNNGRWSGSRGAFRGGNGGYGRGGGASVGFLRRGGNWQQRMDGRGGGGRTGGPGGSNGGLSGPRRSMMVGGTGGSGGAYSAFDHDN